ncbi:hypothetical protein ACEWY4_019901 [Coilia grayii]|uniref:IF rod domain-containing protein n=1 Tax=Coilia grayii TaxID=363190 RepID=A0ABD1JB23_9TELE
MENPTTRLSQSYTCLGQEKQQMLDLNRRLESYLGRVKLLEEENQLLREEIHTLRRNQEPQTQRRALEAALREARVELERAWREKDEVEVEVGNLSAELQSVAEQRQKVAAARAEAQGRLSDSRKELEEERRAQIWLKDKVTQLEGELVFRAQVQEEDVSCLKESLAHARPVQVAPAPHTDAVHAQSVHSLGLEYSQKAAQVWREAAETYQKQVGRLEESLSQAKARMGQISQERKENQLRLQGLAKDLDTARAKKEMLERRVGQQKDRHSQEINQLQAHVEALEEEKTRLGQQIDDLIIESRTLLKLKMSLGLEVATYRTLLDGESLRVNEFSRNKLSIQTVSSTDVFPSLQELKQTLQEAQLSSHMSRPSTTAIRSNLQLKSQLTPTKPASFLTHTSTSTPQHHQHLQEEQVLRSDDWSQLNTGESLNGRDSVEHFRPEEVYEEVTYASAFTAASVTINTFPMEESFERDVAEDKPIVITPEGAPDMLVKEDSTMYDVMVHSTPPAGDTSEPQNFDPQQADVLDMSEGTEPSTGDIGDRTDDFSEWIQPQHEPQVTWAEKDPLKEEKEEKLTNVSAEVNTEFGDLEVMKCMTDLPTTHLDRAETISNGLADREEKNDVFDSETYTDMSQALSAENVVDESDQISALECKEQKTENVCEEGQDEDFLQQEEVKEEAEKEPSFEDKKDTLSSESEETEEITEEKHENTEQYLSTERDLEEDLVSIPHNNFSMNLEIDTLPTHHEQEQIDYSQGHSDVPEDSYNCSEQMEEKDSDDGEGEDGGELDDSPNVSMSWKTDPGELDSYALDNTLADTRPLIRYKSDDTDVNTQASHTFVSDSSDSEDDREAGLGHRAVTKAKRFDTMEDLSEEPEVEAMGEMVLGEAPLSVVRDVHSESHYTAFQEEHGDAESETIVVDTMSALDEERTEIADDHLQCDGKVVDKTQKDLEETLDDKEVDEGTNVMSEEQTERKTNILHEDFPEETVDSVVDLPDQTEQLLNEPHHTEELLNEEVTTESVSQRETYEDLLKPEDQAAEFYTSEEPLKQAEQLLNEPHRTEQLLNEDVIIEFVSQGETTGDLPKPEDQTILFTTSVEPLEQADQLLNEPHHTEQLLNEEVIIESVSQGETYEDLPKPENQTTPFTTSVEPLEQTPNILTTVHDTVELVPKSSEDIFTERITVDDNNHKNDEEDLQDLSMLTHADLADNLSLSTEPSSRPESQPHTANSDDDEDDESRSEEESPNASHCSSPNAFAKLSQAHPALEEASENLPGASFEASGDVLPTAFQGASKCAMEQGHSPEDESEVLNTSADVEGAGDLKDTTDALHPLGENEHPSTEAYAKQPSECVDIFQDEKIDEPPKSNGKDNGLHSFFSSNMEEDFWGSARQMAATFNPDEIKQEQYESVTFQTSESLRSEEAWASPEDHQAANERAEKFTSSSEVPLFGMEEEEEGNSQMKTLLGKEQKQAATTQSDDSIDEGDSWSSGEE